MVGRKLRQVFLFRAVVGNARRGCARERNRGQKARELRAPGRNENLRLFAESTVNRLLSRRFAQSARQSMQIKYQNLQNRIKNACNLRKNA